MTTQLLTPRMGEGVDDVTVMQWLKHEGDAVRELEPLVEVETDKVVTEIPSPADGTLLKIRVESGASAHVGDVLADIGTPGESSEPAFPAVAPKTATAAAPMVPQGAETAIQPAEPGVKGAPNPWVSPLVRKMASENGLNISRITGSGLDGRVTRQDVLDALARREDSASASASATASAAAVVPAGQAAPAVAVTSGQVLTLNPIRRQIAERMLQSVHTAPHVLTVMEADLSRVLAHQQAQREVFSAQGIHLTLTAYFVEAIARALRTHPLVNASWTEEGILEHPQVNVGMTVSLGEAGLIVPVIRSADELSLAGLARAVNDLADRARSKRLTPDEVKGGTFTLTNHGTGGSLFAMPIINQPQVGILGTGSLQKRAVVLTDAHGQDSIGIRPMVYLSFVFDHRVLDGASADAFLADVKKALEDHE